MYPFSLFPCHTQRTWNLIIIMLVSETRFIEENQILVHIQLVVHSQPNLWSECVHYVKSGAALLYQSAALFKEPKSHFL